MGWMGWGTVRIYGYIYRLRGQGEAVIPICYLQFCYNLGSVLYVAGIH